MLHATSTSFAHPSLASNTEKYRMIDASHDSSKQMALFAASAAPLMTGNHYHVPPFAADDVLQQVFSAENKYSSFQLLGYDFMIDSSHR